MVLRTFTGSYFGNFGCQTEQFKSRDTQPLTPKYLCIDNRVELPIEGFNR